MIRPAATPRIRAGAPRRRRGNILIGALVCLLIVSLIAAAVVRLSVANTRLTRQQERGAQALWFTEAGVQRAATELRRSPDYRGERWVLNGPWIGDIAGIHEAIVEIEVEAVEGEPGRRRVTVAAEYPAGVVSAARVKRELVIGNSSIMTPDDVEEQN